MKTTQGRWFINTDSLILSYDNGHLMRIFSFPPGEPPSENEALAWISGEDGLAWMTEDDREDLVRALAELFGRPRSGKATRSLSRHEPELIGLSNRPHLHH